MSANLTERLNKILPKITSHQFLKGKGLGNELAFYIFDYPPEEEITIRKHIQFLNDKIKKQRPPIKVLHINLFQFIIEHLKDKKILDRSFSMEQKQGGAELLKALNAPLRAERIVSLISSNFQPQKYDIVLMDGIGSVWPLVRSHSLLNNIQPIMGSIPLVVFYPGNYDGKALKLFGRIRSNNYYRAFPLVT